MRRTLIPLFVIVFAVLMGWFIGSRYASTPVQDETRKTPTGAHYKDVAGRIVRIDAEQNILTIDHEEIPGFMGAMTMDFIVAVPSELKRLEVGQRIRFDLVQMGSTYQAVRIRPLDASESSEAVESPSAGEIADPLGRGDILPDLVLFNSKGERFLLREMKPRHKIITFFYGRCPLSNFCPAQARRLAELQEQIRESKSEVHLLSISLDAEHDNPEFLSGYAEAYKADPELWTLAGGNNPAAIREFADRAGARIRLDQNTNEIDHALTALRVDGERIVDLAFGLDSIAAMIRRML